MIDPSMAITDLDPFTWRRLGEVWGRVNKPVRRLFILEESGERVRAVTDGGETLDPGLPEERYFGENPALDQILILTREGLSRLGLESQRDHSPQLDTDLFVSRSERALYETEGIRVRDRAGRKGDFWSRARSLIRERLDREHTLGVVLFEGAKLYFHVVLHFSEGQLKTMTSLDHFSEINGSLESVNPGSRSLVERLLDRYFQGKTTLLMMEKDDFYSMAEKAFGR